MPRTAVLAFSIVILSNLAQAQEWKPVTQNWRACADAAADRYAKSTESAPVAARLAIVSCNEQKKQALEAITKTDGASFAAQWIETAEHWYLDVLSVRIIEQRLKN